MISLIQCYDTKPICLPVVNADPTHDPEWTQSRVDTISTNTISNGHDPEWALSRRTRSQMDAIQNGHDPEWALSRMGIIPYGHESEWARSQMSTYIL